MSNAYGKQESMPMSQKLEPLDIAGAPGSYADATDTRCKRGEGRDSRGVLSMRMDEELISGVDVRHDATAKYRTQL